MSTYVGGIQMRTPTHKTQLNPTQRVCKLPLIIEK